MKESDEFLILQKYFKDLGRQYHDSSGILVGPGDDAGLFRTTNSDLIFSTDVSNEGIHFPRNLEPDRIAYRACSVAASDIPACGASLKWLSITLVTSSKSLSWIKKFAKGAKLFTKDYQIPVIGGDLVVGKECSVSVGACGEVKKKDFLSRSGAKVGDSIFVSGILGLSKLGLTVLKNKEKNVSSIDKKHLKKFLKPKVHESLGIQLRGIANSCIDISDGLMGDLGHICKLSGVGAKLNYAAIPYEGNFQDALTWGDDYELCFTVPKNKLEKIQEIEKLLKIKLFKIGEIVKENKIRVFNEEKELFLKKKSYNHFS